jgi:N-acetylneuraminic acid mutarotase
MEKKPTSPSAFFNPRALIILVLCSAAACSWVTGTSLDFLRSEAPERPSQRTLTFEERVAYQRAIEEVYWRHRIWPKERPDRKPSLDALVSQAQIEKKVAGYLRNSQALEDYWQRPITAEQLQAEMDRMATHTRQPEVLRELFEALGNDPFVIAECLARAALADRLVTNWYAYDQRIHGALKQRAEADLQAHPTVEQMKQLSGKYSEIELIKSDSGEDEHNRGHEHGVTLNSREWDETVQRLAATFNKSGTATARSFGTNIGRVSTRSKNAAADEDFGSISIGRVSRLQQDEDRYYVTAVVNKTKEHLKLVTVSWPKEPQESWLARAENGFPSGTTVPGHRYVLPMISNESGCTDTWTATSGAPDGRSGHTAVWTGSEMIIWGGPGFVDVLNTGGTYNPTTDSWTPTTLTNAPDGRFAHTAVWTGSEMIIWGGYIWDNVFGQINLNTGGRYNPVTNSWTATSTNNAPEGRSSHTAVWTGNEMIVWGGTSISSLSSNTGGRYNPNTNSWTATSTTNAPSGRSRHTAVWTGSEMIVWGGYSFEVGDVLYTGGRYNPNTDSWIATSTTDPPAARQAHTAVWTNSEMIIWGGVDTNSNYLNNGARYNPMSNSWTATSTSNTPAARSGHTAVWTGSDMIIWGGFDGASWNTGGKYNPGTDIWTATTMTNVPSGRVSHTAVWTGDEMIVWGGQDASDDLNTGGRYNPTTDSWTMTSTDNTPMRRYRHTAIWTGSEMIIWGGRTRNFSDFYSLDTGGRYDPSTDTWTATSIADAPSGRSYHTAVWTGNEMIVWGGFAPVSFFNTGGRYNPTTNSWTTTNITNAPIGRWFHTAVWTGNRMVVWGGSYDDGSNTLYLNSGGMYDPSADTWVPTSSTNVPTSRDEHVAVWTGDEMIVWGGYFYDGSDHYLNTGGRFDPETNSWAATTTTNAPSARSVPKAIWTGNEMIAWGGYGDAGYINTGGRFNPSANSWTAISATNAPTARAGHAAVWAGSEMIVWGGYFFDGNDHFPNTGGRYNPDVNIWTTTSMLNVPAARTVLTAVWIGSEMIVWGGQLSTSFGTSTGGIYCAQSGPTPTPTPCTGRCGPTPRPRPTPHVRPTR